MSGKLIVGVFAGACACEQARAIVLKQTKTDKVLTKRVRSGREKVSALLVADTLMCVCLCGWD